MTLIRKIAFSVAQSYVRRKQIAMHTNPSSLTQFRPWLCRSGRTKKLRWSRNPFPSLLYGGITCHISCLYSTHYSQKCILILKTFKQTKFQNKTSHVRSLLIVPAPTARRFSWLLSPKLAENCKCSNSVFREAHRCPIDAASVPKLVMAQQKLLQVQALKYI